MLLRLFKTAFMYYITILMILLGIFCVIPKWIFTNVPSIARFSGIYHIYICLQNFLEVVKQSINRAIWKIRNMIFYRNSRSRILPVSIKTTRQQVEDKKININVSNPVLKKLTNLLNKCQNGLNFFVLFSRIVQTCRNMGKFYVLKLIAFTNSYIDTIDIIHKPSGLVNNGNTCYINSIIQMLASSNKTIDHLEKNKSNPTLEVLIDLLHAVNNDKSNVATNTEQLESLIKHINWKKPSQQDSYDFLCALINGVQANLEEEKSMPLKIRIAYKFQGVQIQNRLQTNLGLSIGLCGNYAVYPGVQLNDLIDDYFSPINIDEDINKTVQTCFYEEVPEILLLHIQANKWDQKLGTMIKPKYYIQYCENIELNVTVAQDLYDERLGKSELVKYKLCAFIHHMGDISGGHYVSYRKHNGNWFLVNDIQVTKCKFKSNVCPYILLYEKNDDGVGGN